jgi:hypothetical protein
MQREIRTHHLGTGCFSNGQQISNLQCGAEDNCRLVSTAYAEGGGPVLGTKEPDWLATLAPTQN